MHQNTFADKKIYTDINYLKTGTHSTHAKHKHIINFFTVNNTTTKPNHT